MADKPKLEKQKTILKQLSLGEENKPEEKPQLNKAIENVKKTFSGVGAKQVIDVALFSIGIYVMYKFGQNFAEKIDNQMPTEKGVMDMMRSM